MNLICYNFQNKNFLYAKHTHTFFSFRVSCLMNAMFYSNAYCLNYSSARQIATAVTSYNDCSDNVHTSIAISLRCLSVKFKQL